MLSSCAGRTGPCVRTTCHASEPRLSLPGRSDERGHCIEAEQAAGRGATNACCLLVAGTFTVAFRNRNPVECLVTHSDRAVSTRGPTTANRPG